MNNNSFKYLTEQEKKAILLGVIAKRTNGKLNNEQLKHIVRDIPIDVQYSIKVFSDAKEFGKVITLPDYEMKHSWAGGTKCTAETNILLVSGIKFGRNKHYKYLDNGTLTSEDKWNSLPDFNVKEIHAVSVSIHSFSDYNNEYYDNTDNFIYIYIPSDKPFVVSEEIQYIFDNFNICFS